MKKHLITLLALSASIYSSCFCMNEEKKIESKRELKKTIIINHKGAVRRTTFSDKRYITFSVDDVGAEIYDYNDHKIIKTVNNLAWWPGTPLLNDHNASCIAFDREKDTTYMCSLYDLENDTEKTLLTAPIDSEQPLLQNYFILLGKALLTSCEDRKGYVLHSIVNGENRSFTFKDKIYRYLLSSNKQYLAIVLNNHHLFCSNLSKNEVQQISSQATLSKFSPDSSMLAFFDKEKSVVTLYDTKNFKPLKHQRTKDAIIDIIFPNNTLIFFSPDRQTYTIWDIENDTLSPLDLGSKNFPKSTAIPPVNFIYFNTYPHCNVYNLKTKKLFTLKENGNGARLIFNHDESYAGYTTVENLAALYETKNWQRVTSITFENGYMNPFTLFSPCGEFLAVPSVGAQWIKIYDIKKDTIIFEGPWKSIHPWVDFHPSGVLAFRSNDTDIILYDYKNNRQAGLHMDEKIGSYRIKDDMLTISYGAKTELLYFSDIIFKDCEKDVNYSKLYENYKNITIVDNEWLKNQKGMQFYTHEIAACQRNENTITLYNHSTNKKAEIKRDTPIICFAINDDILSISYDTKQEAIPLKSINFEDCCTKIIEDKSHYCIIL